VDHELARIRAILAACEARLRELAATPESEIRRQRVAAAHRALE
jgi:hypothetical protein